MIKIAKRAAAFFLALTLVVGMLPADTTATEKIKNTKAAATTGFPIFDGKSVPDIYVDAKDYKQIVRAAGDLQKDVARVTTRLPELTNDEGDLKGNVIIVGSVDKSSLIQDLIESGKLDEARGDFADKWESFIIKIVEDPMPGVEQALVIAGSDKRGGVYGIYDVSEQIGVSPWYYWGDIEPKVQSSIYIKDALKVEGEPSVRYRGIFINDEQNLADWAALNDPKGLEGGNIGPDTYSKVYELLLRLKSNYLWTAMHSEPRLGPTDHFNKYPQNRQLADEYGVVVGTSHCEPMMRNGTAEWGEFLVEEGYFPEDTDFSKLIGGSKVDGWFYNWNSNHANEAPIPRYDYSETTVFGSGENRITQREFIDKYWNESVKNYKDYEVSYTLGMRGVHDEGFRTANAGSTDEKTKVLQDVIDSQIQMMETNKVNEEAITIFVPYKEVLPLYQNGLKVPDETTLVWADDNHGFIRYFPTEEENERSGGSGVYYHMNYVGRQTYIWLNSIPPSLVLSEMSKAYESGAKNLWVLNVGDIKPCEIGTEYFLQMAWDIDKWNGDNIIDRESGFFHEIAQKWFPDADPVVISDILTEYYRLNYTRKPEHSGTDKDIPFDLVNYGDEFMQRIADYRNIYQLSMDIYNQLSEKNDYQADAFFTLIGYPAMASYYNNLKNYYSKKSELYASQGRYVAGNACADLVTWAQKQEEAATEFYNKEVFGGKWDAIMNVYNVTYRGNQSPTPKATRTSNIPSGSGLGVVAEGETTLQENSVLDFSAYLTDTHFVDIYNTGSEAFDYAVYADADWVKITDAEGRIVGEKRILIDIDWENLPLGDQSATLTIEGADAEKTVAIRVNNPETSREEITGYAEANGYVAIEAEHFTENVKDENGVGFNVIDGLGRSGASVTAGPMNAANYTDRVKDAPYLSYDVYFRNTGNFDTTIYRLPTLDEAEGQRIAIGVDDLEPVVLTGQGKAEQGNWEKNVTHGIEKLTTKLNIDTAGQHTIKLYMVNTGTSVDRIIINTGGEKESNQGPRESYHSVHNPNPAWTPAIVTTEDSYETEFEYNIKKYANADGLLEDSMKTAKTLLNSGNVSGIAYYTSEALQELRAVYNEVKGKMRTAELASDEKIVLYHTITEAIKEAKRHPAVTVTAVSNEAANLPEYVIDGNLSTRWAAANSGYPRWIQMDLGQVYDLSHIAITWFNSGSGDRAYKYTIDVSEDGKSYTTTIDRSTNTVTNRVEDSLEGISARYIRVNVSGSSSGGSASIYEIEVSSTQESASTAQYTELQNALKTAKAKLEEAKDATVDSYSALKAAMDAAEALTEASTAGEMAFVMEELEDAAAELTEREYLILDTFDHAESMEKLEDWSFVESGGSVTLEREGNNKYLKLKQTAKEEGTAVEARRRISPQSGKLYVEMKVKTDVVEAFAAAPYLYSNEAFLDTSLGGVRMENGNLTAAYHNTRLDTLKAEKWYEVSVILNSKTQQMQIYVDGKRMDDGTFKTESLFRNLGMLRFFADDSGVSESMAEICIDDVSVYCEYKDTKLPEKDPEPTPDLTPTPDPNNQQKLPVPLTEREKKIVSKLGVTEEAAKEIIKVADTYKVDDDTLFITDKAVRAVKMNTDIKGTDFLGMQAKVKKQNNKSATLSWNKVKDADGYLVYGAKADKKTKFKKLTDTKKTGYTNKGLKKGTSYKYMVVAYKNVSGTKVTIAASKTLYTITTGGKNGVAKKIAFKNSKKPISLKVKKTVILKTKETKKDKKIKNIVKVRYESSNPAIATVSKSGKVKGIKKGSCYIYAYAQNGVSAKIKVKVKK